LGKGKGPFKLGGQGLRETLFILGKRDFLRDNLGVGVGNWFLPKKKEGKGSQGN